MNKKLFIAVAALMTSGCCALAACKDNNANNNGEGKKEEEQIKYEGEMLYNGFDSMKDLYAIDQIYKWDYSPLGNLTIVGKDNFLPVQEPESAEIINGVIAQIDALPSKANVKLSDINAVRKARKAYGALSDAGKKQITNISVLKDVESAETIRNYYTLVDFGGSYVNDITNAPEWAPYTGNLVNKKEGHVVFNVKGMQDGQPGAFYISLFHDPSKNAGESADGVMVYVKTNDKALYFDNCGAKSIPFNEGKDIIAGENTVFDYYYKVADDYSKVTITIKMSTERGDVIAEGTHEVTSATFKHFGNKTIKEWLSTGDSASTHYTFFLDTGFSEGGVDITSAWTTAVSETDYEEPAEDPHNADDLAPRQGDGALRVSYESGTFQEILARFERSSLSDLPKKELGGISVKVYNDSATTKSVTLALAGEKAASMAIDNGKFDLAPYTWTTCTVSLDPVIVDFFADKLTGISLDFSSKNNSVYYVDDLTIKFGKTYTDESKALIEKVNSLTTDIAKLDGKTITKDDKATLEDLYTRLNDLPQAYQYTVENSDVLTSAITSYFNAVKSAEEASGSEVTAMSCNELLGLTQMSSFIGGTYKYNTEEKLEGDNGSLELDFDGSMSWITIAIKPIKQTDYDELHIWVKNDSDYARGFCIHWKVSAAQYDVNGNKLDSSGVGIPANSGWIKVVITDKVYVDEFNLVTIRDGNETTSIDKFYVGKVIAVSKAQDVIDAIDELPAYTTGYSAENKAAVAAARSAYDALCMGSAEKVTNISKLIELEAAIWREGFNALPSTVDGITEYKDEWQIAIDALKAAYEALPSEVKAAVKTDEEKLQKYEAKILTYRPQAVNKYIGSLTVKDTLYTIDEISKLHKAETLLKEMSDSDKAQLDAGIEEKLAQLKAKLANYYTLNELGGSFTNDIVGSGDWAAYSANLKNATEGTIIFKVKGISAASGSLYVDIFHDPSKNAGQAGDGVMMYIRDDGTLYFERAEGQAITFKDGKTISAAKTYVFYYTYKVSEDSSKLTVSIRIDEEGGDTIVDGSVDITSVTFFDFDTTTIKAWLTEHENKDNHKTFFIDTGASKGVDIKSAW